MANPTSSPHFEREVDVIAMPAEQPSYVDWSAVFAGTAIASAMSLLLYGFGASVGLYVAQPWANAASTTATVSIAVILFVALAYIYSLALGSYFAGRMRPRHSFNADEAKFRDGANGLVVWAIALLVGALIASNVLVGTADRVATAGYQTAAGVSSAVTPFAEAAVDNMMRAPITDQSSKASAVAPEPAQEAGAAATPEDVAVAPSTATDGPSESAASRPDQPRNRTNNPGPTSTRTADLDFSVSQQQREQIGRIVARSLSQGEMSVGDKRYLANVLESEFGYTPQQALIAVNQNMDQAIKETKSFLVEAKANTAFAGFWTAVVVLLSGLASWWAATLGGAHRDETMIQAN